MEYFIHRSTKIYLAATFTKVWNTIIVMAKRQAKAKVMKNEEVDTIMSPLFPAGKEIQEIADQVS